VREAAARISCSNNLKQISLGTVNCSDTFSTNLPPSIGLWPNLFPTNGNSDGGLFLHILPFIEQDNLYQSSLVPAIIPPPANPDPNDPRLRNAFLATYYQWTASVQQSRVKTYICPSDRTNNPTQWNGTTYSAFSSYAQNGQVFKEGYGQWGGNYSRYPATFLDGTSNTIMYTEKLARCRCQDPPNCTIYDHHDNWWPDWGPVIASYEVFNGSFTGPLAMFQMNPAGDPALCDGRVASSPHTGGINAGMGDGSVRFINRTISPTTWWIALTPDAGDVLPNDW
jgi:prepilin-type processing-associated H-X9-DG protein